MDLPQGKQKGQTPAVGRFATFPPNDTNFTLGNRWHSLVKMKYIFGSILPLFAVLHHRKTNSHHG